MNKTTSKQTLMLVKLKTLTHKTIKDKGFVAYSLFVQ